ncbi:branched-chain amino acid transport system permease protein [Nitrobacteraceae bacterium AZCC 1564]
MRWNSGRASFSIDVTILLCALILPYLTSDFSLFQVSQVMVMAIAILGLTLLVDISGQFSLGHGAFFAFGAYVAAILMEQSGVPCYLALVIAGAASFALGLLLGIPALRLDGVYLAIATFVVGAATPTILKLSVLDSVTGGVQGIYLSKPDVPFGLHLSQDQWLYYIVLFCSAALYIVSLNILGSRSGRALMAIKQNAVASSALGINVPYYKILIFGISAAFAGIAGAINAILVQFVAPEAFTIHLSISLVVGLVLGSLAGLRGALLGAAFIVIVPNWTEHISKGLSGVVFGLILIALTCAMPTLRRLIARARPIHSQ